MPGKEVEATLFSDAGTRRVVTRPFIAVETVLRTGIDVDFDVGPLGTNGSDVAEWNARVLFTEMKLGRHLRHIAGEADDRFGLMPDEDMILVRDAGFVESRIEAQRRLYRLRPEPLMELDAWLVPFRRFWTKHVDALEQHLNEMDTTDHLPAVKGKTVKSKTVKSKEGRKRS